jgi:hypothetical protein
LKAREMQTYKIKEEKNSNIKKNNNNNRLTYLQLQGIQI